MPRDLDNITDILADDAIVETVAQTQSAADLVNKLLED